jgi:hypothetical protein
MTTLKVSSKAPDQTYGTYVSTVWTTVEANAAIIAACLPMVRTLISHMVPQWFAKTRYGRATSLGNSQSQANNSKNKITASMHSGNAPAFPTAPTPRPNPHTALGLHNINEDVPGPIEMNHIRNAKRNAQRPAIPPESGPYMLNSSGKPLSRVTLVNPPKTTDQGVTMEKNGSMSTSSKTESHEEYETAPRQ